jgi:hypothetical protein
LVVQVVRLMPRTKRDSDEDKKLVMELTGEILRRATINGWDKEELALKATRRKSTVSTFYGWRNGSSSPQVAELNDWAKAVGSRVAVVPSSGAVGGAAEGLALASSESLEIASLVDTLSPEERSQIRDMVFRFVRLGGAPHPHKPSGPVGPRPARRQ